MIDSATRLRLVPAIYILADGRICIGKRGDQHNDLLPHDIPWRAEGPIKVWRRGYWDVHTKRFLDVDEVPGGIFAPDETDTARTIREMHEP